MIGQSIPMVLTGSIERMLRSLLIPAVAIFFGTIWTAVNFYNIFAIIQRRVDSVVESVPPTRPEIQQLADSELPTIDVLLPAYKEEEVITRAIRSIREADYLQDRITVNVLLEPDDEQTQAALATIESEYEFQEVIIPDTYLNQFTIPEQYPGRPNKPRALNYGFELTDGDVVGVLDAEDIVDETLFRSVAGALTDADYVQGVLDMVNEEDGWTNLLFRGEYGVWFQLILPSYHHTDYPVPLGGTTNFFHRAVLRDVSESRVEQHGYPWDDDVAEWIDANGLDGMVPWDPKNVTEDFELGLRLWLDEYDLTLIDVRTREESPLSLSAWIRQRTRWQKGKIVTFRQYLRTPPSSPDDQTHVLGQAALLHLGPVNIMGVVILFMIANAANYTPGPFVFGILSLGAAFVVIEMSLQAYGYWIATDRTGLRKWSGTAINFLTLPFYWLLQWGADLRALREAYTDPIHWDKTAHYGRNDPEKNPRLSESTTRQRQTAPQGQYSLQEVFIGLLVLLIGLTIIFGLPLILGS